MTSRKERDDGSARQDFPGGWRGDKVNAFTEEGLSAQQKDAQSFVRKLLNWRKTEPNPFIAWKLSCISHRKTASHIYFRYDQRKTFMMILNKNKTETMLATQRFHEMLAAHTTATDVISGKTFELGTAFAVPARSALILEIK